MCQGMEPVRFDPADIDSTKVVRHADIIALSGIDAGDAPNRQGRTTSATNLNAGQPGVDGATARSGAAWFVENVATSRFNRVDGNALLLQTMGHPDGSQPGQPPSSHHFGWNVSAPDAVQALSETIFTGCQVITRVGTAASTV